MKTLRKLTYFAMLALGLTLTAGCGETAVDSENTTEIAQPAPQPTARLDEMRGNTIGGNYGLLEITADGVYAGTGREYMEQNFLMMNPNPAAPSSYMWRTRLEFIKQTGEVVDPVSFGRPYGERRFVRLTLENEAGLRYMVVGELYFLFKTGSILGGQTLEGYDGTSTASAQQGAANATPRQRLFTVSFEGKLGPMPLQLWDTNLGGRLKMGSILLHDHVTGEKHFIAY